jgi:hypothetical protein
MCAPSYTEEIVKSNYETAEMLFVGKSLGGEKFKVLKNFKGADQEMIDLNINRRLMFMSTCKYWKFEPGKLYFVYVDRFDRARVSVLEAQQCRTFIIAPSQPLPDNMQSYQSLIEFLESDDTVINSFEEEPQRYLTILKRYEKFMKP